MNFTFRVLYSVFLAIAVQMFCDFGYAKQRLVSKHRHWHVYCEKEQRKTTCHLVQPRWYNFGKNRNERLLVTFLGPGPKENALFLISVDAKTVSFWGLEAKVDGVAYDSEQMFCEDHCITLIGVDGAEIEVFRRGRVMTLRRMNAQGEAYGPTVKVSLSGFTAAERAARSIEIKETHKPAVPWTASGQNTVTTKEPVGPDKNIMQTLGVMCDAAGSNGGITLFLQFEDHPDLANVEYIAVWHTLDENDETKVRWTPSALHDGSRGFTLSGDEAQALLGQIRSAGKLAVRTAWTKVTFDVGKNRKVLSGLVDRCLKS